MARSSGPVIQVASGRLLVAEPFMSDPYFSRSVVLLCEHGQEGSVGFILNKELDIRVNDLLSDFPVFDAPVWYGGPVQTDTIHYVHNIGELLEDSMPVAPGIHWGGSFEKLKFLIDNHLVMPANIRFFVGYAGWTDGQLEDEMKIGSWILGESDANYLFRERPGNLWKQVLEHQGGTCSVIAQMPDDNYLN